MRKIGIFGIFDLKAEALAQPPFFSATPGTAERDFRMALSKDEANIRVNAGDYTLLQLGTIEMATGVIEPEPKGPRPLVNGLQLVAQDTLPRLAGEA